MNSIFRFNNDMNNIKQQIRDTFPKNDSDELAFEDVYVPHTNNLVPLWQTDFENAQINFNYSPFVSMFYVIREHPNQFYDMASGHIVRCESDYKEKRKEFNNLYMKILNGGGNGLENGLCSLEEMIRLGSLFYVILQTSDTSKGLQIDNEKRFKADWCKDSKDVVFDHDEILDKSKKLQDVYFSDSTWNEIFYRFLPQTDKNTFWFVKMPDFLSRRYQNKVDEVDEYDWIDKPTFKTFVRFIDKVEKENGYIAIYYRSKTSFKHKLVDSLGLKKNLSGVYQNSHKYLFDNKLDETYEIISNYDVNKPVKWEKSYNAK